MELTLEAHCASDLRVVNAARVSFSQRSQEMTEDDDKLIGYLMRNKHGSPFEHGYFCFHVKAPIFVIREWQRHRTWSYNEMSARYTEMPAEFYRPEEFRRRIGKPGHYTYEALDEASSEHAGNLLEDFYDDVSWLYAKLGRSIGVAPELARLCLPVGTYTQMYASVDPRNLMKFLELRTHETAQKEIRDLAFLVEDHFAHIMPVTYKHWNENGRVSP